MNWLLLIISFVTIAFAFILYRTIRVMVRPVFAGKPNPDCPNRIIFQINNYIQDGKWVSGSKDEKLYYLADNSLRPFGLPEGELIAVSSVRASELRRGDLLVLRENDAFVIRICLGNNNESIQYFESSRGVKLEFCLDEAEDNNLQQGFFKTSNGEVREIDPSHFDIIVGKVIHTLTE